MPFNFRYQDYHSYYKNNNNKLMSRQINKFPNSLKKLEIKQNRCYNISQKMKNAYYIVK